LNTDFVIAQLGNFVICKPADADFEITKLLNYKITQFLWLGSNDNPLSSTPPAKRKFAPKACG
jgi:hypothetical protein